MPRLQVGALIVDYQEAGTGLPVIFIPGITEYKEAFLFQYRGLQEGYHVIGYDVRRGLKRAADYTLELLVGDLKQLLEALRLSSAVICGHSFGGLIAMQFALQFPEETKALVLVSSFPAAPDAPPERFLGGISSAGHPFHTSLRARVAVQVARWFGRRTAGMLTKESEMAAVRTLARQAARTSPSTIAQRMRIIQKADFRTALPAILAPTLIIAGAKDRGFFLANAQHMYESIPNASLEVIDGGGHFCFLTKHDQFNAVVDDFVTQRLAEMA